MPSLTNIEVFFRFYFHYVTCTLKIIRYLPVEHPLHITTKWLKDVESAMTENTEAASSRLGVCPRVVALDKVGSYQRVPVHVFNISARPLTSSPQTTLCELQEVKVLRQADFDIEQDDENTATIASHIAGESEQKLPDGVNLNDTDLKKLKEEAYRMFSKWNSVFSKGDMDIGHTNLVEHHIKLDKEEPFKDPHRRIPPGLISEVREHLQKMLDAGVIRNSESPFSSNVVIVRKKDGTIRLCVDFRKLNNRTIKDTYAIPRIEDSLHLLAGSKYFSKLGTGKLKSVSQTNPRRLLRQERSDSLNLIECPSV